MKKLFAILLCVFVLLQGGILSFQYVVKLIQHKVAVERGLEGGLYNTQLISFTTSQLMYADWENAHEFVLGDEKYDVVSTTIIGGESCYRCINDEMEKILVNSLDKSEKKSNLIEELIKKINVQVNQIETFEFSCSFIENIHSLLSYRNTYSFIFSRFINKPPAI